jgi:hypothetical protein
MVSDLCLEEKRGGGNAAVKMEREGRKDEGREEGMKKACLLKRQGRGASIRTHLLLSA